MGKRDEREDNEHQEEGREDGHTCQRKSTESKFETLIDLMANIKGHFEKGYRKLEQEINESDKKHKRQMDKLEVRLDDLLKLNKKLEATMATVKQDVLDKLAELTTDFDGLESKVQELIDREPGTGTEDLQDVVDGIETARTRVSDLRTKVEEKLAGGSTEPTEETPA